MLEVAGPQGRFVRRQGRQGPSDHGDTTGAVTGHLGALVRLTNCPSQLSREQGRAMCSLNREQGRSWGDEVSFKLCGGLNLLKRSCMLGSKRVFVRITHGTKIVTTSHGTVWQEGGFGPARTSSWGSRQPGLPPQQQRAKCTTR